MTIEPKTYRKRMITWTDIDELCSEANEGIKELCVGMEEFDDYELEVVITPFSKAPDTPASFSEP